LSAISSIEWTDRTWNPVRGCSRVSPGCDNCYAMRVAHRFAGPAVQDPSGDVGRDKAAGPYHGLTVLRPKTASRPGVDWSGRVRFVPEMLDEPLRWRKPQRVFVNSMSDLFHEGLDNEQIAAVFGVMAACPQHTFQVLTKRPKRAAAWFRWIAEQEHPDGGPGAADVCGVMAANHGAEIDWLGIKARWPLPNVWLGVSVENQDVADERIPLLLRIPAAVRFISAEPLLGPLDLITVRERNEHTAGIEVVRDALRANALSVIDYAQGNALDWVIVGGESGAGARPFHFNWARAVIYQCRAASVACFVKQVGARPLRSDGQGFAITDRKGGDMAEWPESLRVRQFPTTPAELALAKETKTP
jgi:protein gp37